MNALALIIGNAKYTLEQHKLVNAVNDADDLAKKLMELGFTVKKKTDCTRSEFDNTIKEFSEDLQSYQIGLFYFSGHGLQIEGLNYITSIDTSFADATSAKYTSNRLDEIIERMKGAKPTIMILILDACRDNPLPTSFRGLSDQGLAPIHAPKGTIIAFSTSPGEKAMDYGAGRNSIYTGSLLKHIDDPNIPIEEFFKRVRTSVYNLSEGKQTSWEHTSLIGNFCFNSGQLVHSIKTPYTKEFIADHLFQTQNKKIDEIILSLKSYDWYRQNPAIEQIDSLTMEEIDSNYQFLLGRNIIQAAIGGAYAAARIMRVLSTWLIKYSRSEGNHILNGMLYEMYFDSYGLFRNGEFKSAYVDELYALQTNSHFEKSFEFIKTQLLPFKDQLFYLPTNPPSTLALEAIFKEQETEYFDDYKVKLFALESIKHETSELLHSSSKNRVSDDTVSLSDFKAKIKTILCVPSDKLTLSTNIPENTKSVKIPWKMRLSRDRTFALVDLESEFNL